MNEVRTIGLVGGLGVGAAVHYYRYLADAAKLRGCDLKLVMAHAESTRAVRFVENNDKAGLAAYLVSFIQQLKEAGADFAVIPAVTPHYCIDHLEEISPLPIVGIFEPLVEYLASASVKKAAIFGTRFVMNSNFFDKLPGVEFVRGTPEETERVHSIYMEVATTGKTRPGQAEELTDLAQRLMNRDGAETIIFGGTDLILLFGDGQARFPNVDCAALHLKRIETRAFEGGN